MQTPKDADEPPDEVRSPEVVAAVLGETPGKAPHPPIASAMGG